MEMKQPKRRPVYVERIGDTYFIKYADRKYHARHSFAQFYEPDITLDEVRAWVVKQPNLILVDKPQQ